MWLEISEKELTALTSAVEQDMWKAQREPHPFPEEIKLLHKRLVTAKKYLLDAKVASNVLHSLRVKP